MEKQQVNKTVGENAKDMIQDKYSEIKSKVQNYKVTPRAQNIAIGIAGLVLGLIIGHVSDHNDIQG